MQGILWRIKSRCIRGIITITITMTMIITTTTTIIIIITTKYLYNAIYIRIISSALQ